MAYLIGLGGALRSGKDAYADHLVAKHGFLKTYMSQPLDAALRALNPWVPVNEEPDPAGRKNVLYGRSMRYADFVNQVGYTDAKQNPEVRRLLQKIGTEVGREQIYEDVWVDVAKKNIRAALDQNQNIAITGIRYPNELAMIRSLGGISVYLRRPGLNTAAEHAAHTSENGVQAEEFDMVVENDSTLEELYRRADVLIRSLKWAEDSRAANTILPANYWRD